MRKLFVLLALAAACGAATTAKPKPAAADPTPGEPLTVTMGQRTPFKVRVATWPGYFDPAS